MLDTVSAFARDHLARETQVPHPIIFTVQASSHAGRRLEIKASKFAIGSSRRCGLRLVAPGVAPLHCLVIRGLASTIVLALAAPTRINGRPVSRGVLREGDLLTVGPVTLRLGNESESMENCGPRRRAVVRQRLREETRHLPGERPRDENAGDLSLQTAARSPNSLETLPAPLSELHASWQIWVTARGSMKGQLQEVCISESLLNPCGFADWTYVLPESWPLLPQDGSDVSVFRSANMADSREEIGTLESLIEKATRGVESIASLQDACDSRVKRLDRLLEGLAGVGGKFEELSGRLPHQVAAIESLVAKLQQWASDHATRGPGGASEMSSRGPTPLAEPAAERTPSHGQETDTRQQQTALIDSTEGTQEKPDGQRSDEFRGISVPSGSQIGTELGLPQNDTSPNRQNTTSAANGLMVWGVGPASEPGVLSRDSSLPGTTTPKLGGESNQDRKSAGAAASPPRSGEEVSDHSCATASENSTNPNERSESPDHEQHDQLVREYMRELLSRLRAAGGRTEPQDSPDRSEPNGAEPPSQSKPRPALSIGRMNWARAQRKRGVAPEKQVDFAAMRELANLSSQAAIDRYAKAKLMQAQRGKLLVLLTAGAAALSLTGLGSVVGMSPTGKIALALTLIVAIVYGIQYAILTGKLIINQRGQLQLAQRRIGREMRKLVPSGKPLLTEDSPAGQPKR